MSYPYYSKLDNPYNPGPAPGYVAPPAPYGAQHNVPPYGGPHDVPRYPSDYRKKSSGSICLRCMCCCCCFSIIFIIATTIFTMSMLNIYDPKVPEYKIEGIQVKKFEVQPDATLNTEFEVDVKVDNPNKKLGFNYGEDNIIEVLFMNQHICNGKLPPFHQEAETTTDMKLTLTGQIWFSPELQDELTASTHLHNIPVEVNVRVPINIVVGRHVNLREFEIFVYCNLTLDNLTPNGAIGILSKATRFKFEL